MCYIKKQEFRKELMKEMQHNNKASATLNKPVTTIIMQASVISST